MNAKRLLLLVLVAGLLAGCASPTPFRGPASAYLPAFGTLPNYLKSEENRAAEQFLRQADRLARDENRAYASFANTGHSTTYQPQDGVYLRLVYGVVVLRSVEAAAAYVKDNQGEAQRKQNFLVVMPAAVHADMPDPVQVPLNGAPCEDAALYKFSSAIIFTPDLYLYASCRIENVALTLWAHTPDNYDGNNAPIPDTVIAQQMMDWMTVAAARVKK